MNEVASVILLSYKKFDYIFTSINSVLSQTYKEIELIVADDGSPNFEKDRIINYIDNHRSNNIVNYMVYSNQVNQGTVKNINNAIKRSTGKYILIMACDDCFYDSTVVSNVVNRLNRSSNGVITCRRLMCDEMLNGLRYMPSDSHIKEISKFNTVEKQHKAFVYGQFYEMASGSCTYYLRDKLESDGMFNEQYKLLEDWTHFIEITRHTYIEQAYDIVSVKYRGGGISSSIPQPLLDDYILMMKNERDNLPDYSTSFYKRYVDFNILRFIKNKYLIYLIFPDVFIKRSIYKIKSDIYNKKGINQYNKNL